MEIEINNVKITLTKEQEDEIRRGVCANDRKPEWEDIGEIEGAYIDTFASVCEYAPLGARNTNKNTFPTIEEAEACLALSQLLQWRDKYNEGWKPDWDDSKVLKHTIHFRGNNAIPDFSYQLHKVLAFKSPEIRDKFMHDFKELIEIAKPLL